MKTITFKPKSLASRRGKRPDGTVATAGEHNEEFRTRELILKILQKEVHVSGEQIGKRFNVSRTAVWKHIQELRKKGYEIKSAPRLGYTFIKSTDLLLPEEVGSELGTYVIGKHILYYDEVPSTQDIAAEFAGDGSKEGVVIISERQTRGRGRKGRKWISPSREGVYLSIVLRPNIRPSLVHLIPLVAEVAVCKAIQKATGLDARIKWPNDILVNGKKVCGILTEMNCEIDKVNYVILGMGVNVNTQVSNLPESMSGIATSMAQESGQTVSRVKFVQALLTEFEVRYREFLVSGFGVLRKDWLAMSSTIGSWVKVTCGDEEIEGKAVDINDEGLLVIQEEGGALKTASSGDVSA